MKTTLPPNSESAERDLISGVFQRPTVFDEVLHIDADKFYNQENVGIWEAISHLHTKRKQITPVAVAEWLESEDKITPGTVAHLTGILNDSSALSHFHVATNAAIVLKKWRARRAIYGCRDVLSLAEKSANEDKISEAADKTLTEIAEASTPTAEVAIGGIMQDVMSDIQARLRGGRAAGLPTGFAALDKKLIGLLPHELIVLAARPAMGKTAFVCGLALNVANAGGPVMLHSLEMSKTEIVERMLCIHSETSGTFLKSGHVGRDALTNERVLDDLMRASQHINTLPIFIDDNPNQKVRTIISTARRLKRKHGLALIVIDYLQIMEPRDWKIPREQQVAQTSKALKGLAKELQVPVLVIAQLNRESEKRGDKKPILSDLRESGSVEQDADVVMMLHRPSVYDPSDRPGEADIMILKNRRGEIGTVQLGWNGERTKFSDLEEFDSVSHASKAFPSRDWDR